MWFTDSLPILLFFTGLAVGFGHCIGMCGPIVVSLSLNLKGRPVITSHLLYNAGRITTYILLGGLMGLTGSFTLVVSGIEDLQKGILILAGTLIIFMGAAMSGLIPLGRIFIDFDGPRGLLSRGFRRLSALKSPLAHYPLGIFLGFLPCGPVYTALLAAARAGMEAGGSLEGFVRGATLMLAFGLGTVPSLLLVARLSDIGWLKKREILYRAGSVLMMVVGVYFVVKGIRY